MDPNGLATWPVDGFSKQIVGNQVNDDAGKFGYSRTNSNGNRQQHKGADAGGNIGQPVRAYKDGTVQSAEYNGKNGLRVILRHNDNGKISYSTSSHLRSIAITRNNYVETSGHVLSKGDIIKEGQNIGTLGKSGNASNHPYPHVHFKITDAQGKPLNPSDQFTPAEKVIQGIPETRFITNYNNLPLDK